MQQFSSIEILSSTWISNSWAHPEILMLEQSGKLKKKIKKKERKKKGILACSSAYVLRDMHEVISTSKESSGFFHYKPYLIWDMSLPWTISNHPFMWIKHFFKKITLHLKVKILALTKNLLLSFTLWTAWPSTVGKKISENQHENNDVDVLPRVHIRLKNRLLPSVVEIHQLCPHPPSRAVITKQNKLF